MFGLFKPKCPVSLREKVWTELRLAWLADRFGLDRMLSAEVILPTGDYFPDTFNGTEADARRLLDRVCKFMGVDATRIELRVRSDEETPYVAGSYEPGETATIAVEPLEFDDQERLIATLAHGVAQHLLHRGEHLQGDEGDGEQLPDLLTAFLGMGVFAANTAVQQSASHDGTWEYWSIRTLGYLTARVYGYAFALIEWTRGDVNPRWARCVGDDAKYAMRDGLKYLTKTGDSLFQRDLIKKYAGDRSTSELVADLTHESESVCVAALWSLGEQQEKAASSVVAVTECLRTRTPAVRSEAALALGSIGETAREAAFDLMDLLRSPEAANRSAAATAIGLIRPSLEQVGSHGSKLYDELAILQDDRNRDTANAAASALAGYGQACSSLAPRLLPSLKRSIIECNFPTIEHYLRVLLKIVPDVDQFLEKELASLDAELYENAVYSLTELRTRQKTERITAAARSSARPLL